MIRVIGYIDGFNLYFGLRHKGWRKYYWLDVVALMKALLKSGQLLEVVRYFTSRLRAAEGRSEDVARQSVYLDALTTLANVDIQEGHYLKKRRNCYGCGASWMDYEEKMTDVNIATALLIDAFDDRFDTALIVSGDSDLARPLEVVRRRFPNKRIVVAFPPHRHSDRLRRIGHAAFTIGEQKFRHSLLPEQITLPNGHVLHRPGRWR